MSHVEHDADTDAKRSGSTILLVEDETIVALAERKMLERFGYAVEIAKTGERAVELVTERRELALVLMDIDLGDGIDGTEAAQRILERRRLPVVFLTAHAEPEYLERMRSITRYGYLLKGSAEAVIKTTIETAFELFDSHEKTRLQEAKYEYLFNNTPAAVALVDKQGGIVQTNAEFTRLFGFSAAEAQGQQIDELIVPEELQDEAKGLTSRVVKGGEIRRNTTRLRKDGEYVEVEVRAERAQLGDQWLAHVMYHDIGPHKRAERALQEREREFRLIFEHAPLGILRFDRDGVITDCNINFVEIIGSSREALIGLEMRNLPDRRVVEALEQALSGGIGSFEGEYRSFTAEKATSVRLVFSPVLAGDGTVDGGIGIVESVEARKQAETKLRYQYELQQMIAKVSAAFVQAPPDQIDGAVQSALERMGRCLSTDRVYVFRFDESQAVYSNTHEWCADGVQPVIEEMQDIPFESTPWLVEQHLSGRVLALEDIDRSEEMPSDASLDRELLRSQGIRALLNLPLEEHNRVVGFIGFDIVGRARRWLDEEVAMLQVVGRILSAASITQQAYREVKGLLQEKELILREVHHRVKNNMNTVISLLSVQAEMLSDPEASAALQEANNRLRSMGVLYDKLYRAEQFGEASMKPYLTDLVHETTASFSNRDEVHVETEIAEIVIGTRPLSTVGIVVNELVTNSMKHAFVGKNDREARVMVSAAREGARVRVVVRDNGVGIASTEHGAAPEGFGLQLVSLLTEQLGGSLTVNHHHGSEFVLEFVP